MSNKYGYVRVSSNDQNPDRQIIQLKALIPDDRFIICDKESGKDFNRKGYNMLVGTDNNAPLLREGDLLIITSLDRLGRNYTEIRHQWEHITHTLKADIRVLDMPLLDTSNVNDSLDKRFIADLVLQILSYTAEKERTHIKDRQREGIAAARLTGKHLGRPKAEYPHEWDSIYNEWKMGNITAVFAMEKLNLKPTTFYKLAKQYNENK